MQPDSCWPFLPFWWVVCIGPSETWRPVLKLILNDIRSKVKLVWFDRRPSRWQTEKHHTSRICARLEVRRHLVSFQKSYGVGNARVSVMAACGQARDGVVEAVLTCQVGEHSSDSILLIFHPTSQIFSMRFNFQGDIDDPDFPDRCQKMFNRLSHVLDNSEYLGVKLIHLLTTFLPRRARCDEVRAVELCEGDVQPTQRCSGKAGSARTVWR